MSKGGTTITFLLLQIGALYLLSHGFVIRLEDPRRVDGSTLSGAQAKPGVLISTTPGPKPPSVAGKEGRGHNSQTGALSSRQEICAYSRVPKNLSSATQGALNDYVCVLKQDPTPPYWRPLSEGFEANYPTKMPNELSNPSTFVMDFGDGKASTLSYAGPACPGVHTLPCLQLFRAVHNFDAPGAYTGILYKGGTEILRLTYTVAPPPSSVCQLDGIMIPEGRAVMAAQLGKGADGEPTCDVRTRECHNGMLSGSFPSLSCSGASPTTNWDGWTCPEHNCFTR